MALSVTKKVRLSDERAAQLEHLADKLDMTESDVLRYGLDLVDRMEARRENVQKLIDLIDGEEPPKIRFHLK